MKGLISVLLSEKDNTEKNSLDFMTNDDIIDELDEFYNKTVVAFENNLHICVFNILSSIFTCEAFFRQFIGSQLHGNLESNLLVSESELQQSVELLGHLNVFRINLMTEILKNLTNSYRYSISEIKINFKNAYTRFNNTKECVSYYSKKIKELYVFSENNDYYQEITFESYKLFDDLALKINQSLQKFINFEFKENLEFTLQNQFKELLK